jgi:hypothetical protein
MSSSKRIDLKRDFAAVVLSAENIFCRIHSVSDQINPNKNLRRGGGLRQTPGAQSPYW